MVPVLFCIRTFWHTEEYTVMRFFTSFFRETGFLLTRLLINRQKYFQILLDLAEIYEYRENFAVSLLR